MANSRVQTTEKLIHTQGRNPTELKDRKYFRSIYFCEPGGVLFQIAIDPRILRSTAGRGTGSGLGAAELSRTASQGDRGLAARSRDGGVATNKFT